MEIGVGDEFRAADADADADAGAELLMCGCVEQHLGPLTSPNCQQPIKRSKRDRSL